MHISHSNDSLCVPNNQKSVIRKLVISLIRSGPDSDQFSANFNVTCRAIPPLIARFASGGYAALHSKSKPGRPRKLSPEQMLWVLLAVRGKTLLQCKFEFADWTVRRVRLVILPAYGVGLAIERRVPHLVGWTLQWPQHRALQQDLKAVNRSGVFKVRNAMQKQARDHLLYERYRPNLHRPMLPMHPGSRERRLQTGSIVAIPSCNPRVPPGPTEH